MLKFDQIVPPFTRPPGVYQTPEMTLLMIQNESDAETQKWMIETIEKFASPKIENEITVEAIRDRKIIITSIRTWPVSYLVVLQDGQEIGERFAVHHGLE